MTNTQAEVVRPKVVVLPDASAASNAVAEMIAGVISANHPCVLGLATGGTPVESYRRLIQLYQDSEVDFADVTTFNLDEYVGLSPDHPQSYRYFMQEHLFSHVNLEPSRTHVPDGIASDLLEAAADYERKIVAAGGIDLQLLGIGHNGHIAFNEPGAPRDSRTRVVELAEQTISKNARYFESIDEVPRTAVTMGIGTIMEAKQIVLLATGPGKAEAAQRAIEGPPSEEHPASLLQFHPAATFILDEAAASQLASNAR